LGHSVVFDTEFHSALLRGSARARPLNETGVGKPATSRVFVAISETEQDTVYLQMPNL